MHKNRKTPELTFELVDSLFYCDPVLGKVYSKVKRGKGKSLLNVGDECGGFQSKKGYWALRFNVNGIRYHEKRSRIIFILMNKRTIKEGYIIDHINGVPCDNSIINLQEIDENLNCIKANLGLKKRDSLPRNVHKFKNGYRVSFTRLGKKVYQKWKTLEEATVDAQR